MFVISMKMTKDDTEKKTRPSAVGFTMAHFSHNEKKTGIINFVFFLFLLFFPSKTKLQQFFLSFHAFEEPIVCAKYRSYHVTDQMGNVATNSNTVSYFIVLFKFSHTFHGI